jgi:hypothetical protein
MSDPPSHYKFDAQTVQNVLLILKRVSKHCGTAVLAGSMRLLFSQCLDGLRHPGKRRF